MDVFRSIVDLVDRIVLGILTFLRIICTGIGWFVSFVIFCTIVGGIFYYFVKPDLPPQELREIGFELFPTQFEYISKNSVSAQILPWFDIDPLDAKNLTVSEN